MYGINGDTWIYLFFRSRKEVPFAARSRIRSRFASQRSQPASTKSSLTRRSRILSHLMGPKSSR